MFDLVGHCWWWLRYAKIKEDKRSSKHAHVTLHSTSAPACPVSLFTTPPASCPFTWISDPSSSSAPKAIGSLAKKQSDVTRQGTQKLKFVPTLPQRRKKESVICTSPFHYTHPNTTEMQNPLVLTSFTTQFTLFIIIRNQALRLFQCQPQRNAAAVEVAVEEMVEVVVVVETQHLPLK